MTEQLTRERTKDDIMYDEAPYASFPFEFTRPEYLHAVAQLFGLQAPDVENARVLEIGGSDGNNIIRFASTYKNSYCLGVDTSITEITKGKERIERIGLKNYDLKNMSITDLDLNGEKFDYIICHGVFSWVPEFVRESILEVSNKLLSDNGVAFISYNALPGWNEVGTVRKLMQYHASAFKDPQDKANQARLAVQFVYDAIKETGTTYSKYLKSIIDNVCNKPNYYLLHDYIIEENTAFYLHEFVEKAGRHDLQYLGDTELQRMFVGNLPKEAAEKLKNIQDIVRAEQYMDFIRNAQFRCTMLCKKTAQLNRQLNADRLSSMLYSAGYQVEEELTSELLNSDKPVKFMMDSNKDVAINTSNPLVKAIFNVFVENPHKVLSLDDITKSASKFLKKFTQEDVKRQFLAIVGELVFTSHFKIHSVMPKITNGITSKPKISDVNLDRVKNIQSNEQLWFINELNNVVMIRPAYVHSLAYVDGKHTKTDIQDQMIKLIESQQLKVEIKGELVTAKKEIKKVANDHVNELLSFLDRNNLLVN